MTNLNLLPMVLRHSTEFMTFLSCVFEPRLAPAIQYTAPESKPITFIASLPYLITPHKKTNMFKPCGTLSGGDGVLRVQARAAAHQAVLGSPARLHSRRALDASQVHVGAVSRAATLPPYTNTDFRSIERAGVPRFQQGRLSKLHVWRFTLCMVL